MFYLLFLWKCSLVVREYQLEIRICSYCLIASQIHEWQWRFISSCYWKVLQKIAWYLRYLHISYILALTFSRKLSIFTAPGVYVGSHRMMEIRTKSISCLNRNIHTLKFNFFSTFFFIPRFPPGKREVSSYDHVCLPWHIHGSDAKIDALSYFNLSIFILSLMFFLNTQSVLV